MAATVAEPGQGWLCEVDFGHGFWTPLGALVAGEWRLSQKPSFEDVWYR
jgi:hypothetical protein